MPSPRTGRRASVPGVSVAGKTGTTDNYADAWFVGFTPELVVAVWVVVFFGAGFAATGLTDVVTNENTGVSRTVTAEAGGRYRARDLAMVREPLEGQRERGALVGGQPDLRRLRGLLATW